MSTADYPYLEELIEKLQRYFLPKQVGVSVPSLRVDSQLALLPKMVSSVRKSGMTIAVEAASERLRKIINKPITDENLFAAVGGAYAAGFEKLKLYFMVGFPGETESEIAQIVDLCGELGRLRKKYGKGPGQINAAVSWLVPKAHTPFAFGEQKSAEYFQNAKKIILDRKYQLGIRFVKFKFHDIDRSVLESAVGRGDRRLADVIEYVFVNGGKFDLWDECFDFELWKRGFEKFGLDIYAQAGRGFEPSQITPWGHLGGPARDMLIGHYNAAVKIAR